MNLTGFRSLGFSVDECFFSLILMRTVGKREMTGIESKSSANGIYLVLETLRQHK
jgi:hypothetical protein